MLAKSVSGQLTNEALKQDFFHLECSLTFALSQEFTIGSDRLELQIQGWRLIAGNCLLKPLVVGLFAEMAAHADGKQEIDNDTDASHNTHLHTEALITE